VLRLKRGGGCCFCCFLQKKMHKEQDRNRGGEKRVDRQVIN
jgi:hypothetical protein